MKASSVPFGSQMSIRTLPFENGRIAGSFSTTSLSSFADLFLKESRGACGLSRAVWARRIHSSTSPFDASFGLKGRAADILPIPSGSSCTEIVQDHSLPSVETVHRIGHLHCTFSQLPKHAEQLMTVNLLRAGPTVTGDADLH